MNWNFKTASEFVLSSFPPEGWFSEESQYWILRLVHEWRIEEAASWIDVGGPGADGISWAVRRDHPGVWAYYPIDDDFEFIASGSQELIRGWSSGSISV